MNIDKIKRKKRKEIRSKLITIRTFPSYSKWMAKEDISPSALFNEALKDVMEKHGNKKTD